MKILLIDASPRVGFTAQAIVAIQSLLQCRLGPGDEYEVLSLRDEKFDFCAGCCACLSTGRAACRFRDDAAQRTLQKMIAANGVIIVTPNYSLQVPALLKNLLDRLAFVFHRPRLFHRTFLPIVVQGVYGGGKIAAYLNEVMQFWGMRPVKGAVIAGGIHPKQSADPNVTAKNHKKLQAAIDRFAREISDPRPARPSLKQVVLFRATRASMIHFDEALPADKTYFFENGWQSSSYYYPVKLGLFKRLAGALMDHMIAGMAFKAKSAKSGKMA